MSNKKTIFALTFLSYAFLHAIRISWAYVKPYLQHEPLYFSKKFLGILDMIWHLSLAISLKGFGWVGDKIGYKLFLLIGMVTLTLTFLCLSLFLLFEIKSSFIYILMFTLVGLFSCTGWPACLSIMSLYYPAQQNGFLLSLWNGCSQFGDFVILTIGYIITHKMKYPAQGIIIIMALFLIIMLVVDWLFLHPKQKFQKSPQSAKISSVQMSLTTTPSIVQTQLDKQNNKELDIILKIQTNIHLFQSEKKEQKQQSHQLRQQTTVNFINVWFLPSVTSYVLCFGCMKSANSILLNWLVAYLFEIGLKSYLSPLTIAWCISSFLGSLMMGHFNKTVNRMGLIIPLLFCSLIFIMLANQAKQIGIYVYFTTITIAGFCFGGPYGLVGSKVVLSLANNPQIKSMKGAMGVIISLMQGFGQLSASFSMIIVPLVGLDHYFYIPFVMCSLSAAILFFQHLKQQQKNKKLSKQKRQTQLKAEQQIISQNSQTI